MYNIQISVIKNDDAQLWDHFSRSMDTVLINLINIYFLC